MPERFFSVELSVKPIGDGKAELVLPKVLKGLNYRFLIVRDGCEEGIIKLDGSEKSLKKIENDKACKKVSPEEMNKLKSSYPAPKLKKKYRTQLQINDQEVSAEQSETNKERGSIIDTVQTVRSGFYLIDVPLL